MKSLCLKIQIYKKIKKKLNNEEVQKKFATKTKIQNPIRGWSEVKTVNIC